jgi:hypothetical protein
MRFTMHVDVEGAAFAPDHEPELGRILTDVAMAVEEGETTGVCLDANGNTCGGWEVTGG